MARPQSEIAREMADHYAALSSLWAEMATASKRRKPQVKPPNAPVDKKTEREVARKLRRLQS